MDMTPPFKPTGHNRLSLELLSLSPTYSNKYAWLKQTRKREKFWASSTRDSANSEKINYILWNFFSYLLF